MSSLNVDRVEFCSVCCTEFGEHKEKVNPKINFKKHLKEEQEPEAPIIKKRKVVTFLAVPANASSMEFHPRKNKIESVVKASCLVSENAHELCGPCWHRYVKEKHEQQAGISCPFCRSKSDGTFIPGNLRNEGNISMEMECKGRNPNELVNIVTPLFLNGKADDCSQFIRRNFLDNKESGVKYTTDILVRKKDYSFAVEDVSEIDTAFKIIEFLNKMKPTFAYSVFVSFFCRKRLFLISEKIPRSEFFKILKFSEAFVFSEIKNKKNKQVVVEDILDGYLFLSEMENACSLFSKMNNKQNNQTFLNFFVDKILCLQKNAYEESLITHLSSFDENLKFDFILNFLTKINQKLVESSQNSAETLISKEFLDKICGFVDGISHENKGWIWRFIGAFYFYMHEEKKCWDVIDRKKDSETTLNTLYIIFYNLLCMRSSMETLKKFLKESAFFMQKKDEENGEKHLTDFLFLVRSLIKSGIAENRKKDLLDEISSIENNNGIKSTKLRYL